jgi:hypothetical protein
MSFNRAVFTRMPVSEEHPRSQGRATGFLGSRSAHANMVGREDIEDGNQTVALVHLIAVCIFLPISACLTVGYLTRRCGRGRTQGAWAVAPVVGAMRHSEPAGTQTRLPHQESSSRPSFMPGAPRPRPPRAFCAATRLVTHVLTCSRATGGGLTGVLCAGGPALCHKDPLLARVDTRERQRTLAQRSARPVAHHRAVARPSPQVSVGTVFLSVTYSFRAVVVMLRYESSLQLAAEEREMDLYVPRAWGTEESDSKSSDVVRARPRARAPAGTRVRARHCASLNQASSAQPRSSNYKGAVELSPSGSVGVPLAGAATDVVQGQVFKTVLAWWMREPHRGYNILCVR